MSTRVEVAIVGGGIVGLASAWQLQQRLPGRAIVLLEKEHALATHQSGRNSGVLHAGVYYAPGSLKARYSRAGAAQLRAFCSERAIPVDACGKLIVASRAEQLPRFEALTLRARTNGIACEVLDADDLARREPRLRGVAALRVPSTAVTDFRQVCAALAREFTAAGGEIRLGCALQSIREGGDAVRLDTTQGALNARALLACAGLQADRVARLAGLDPGFRIVPFRGEFYRLAKRFDGALQSLVYPVPDPALPFLGVHLTRLLDGGIKVGPNAVPSLAREGYARRAAVNWRDLGATAGFGGSWRFLRRHWRHALGEMRDSLWKRGYLRAVQRYCPEVQLEDLEPYPCGIRAQALGRDGRPVEDFLFLETARTLHVGNAPSPAATACLPIGAELAERVVKKLSA